MAHPGEDAHPAGFPDGRTRRFFGHARVPSQNEAYALYRGRSALFAAEYCRYLRAFVLARRRGSVLEKLKKKRQIFRSLRAASGLPVFCYIYQAMHNMQSGEFIFTQPCFCQKYYGNSLCRSCKNGVIRAESQKSG